MPSTATRHLVVLPVGTRVMPALLEVVKENGITGGTVQGIGAFEDTELGFYERETQDYNRRTVPGSMEVVSFLGNISLVDGEPFIHAHVALGLPDFSMVGGHFFDATVSVTGEFYIDAWGAPDGAVVRTIDPQFQLKLITAPAPAVRH